MKAGLIFLVLQLIVGILTGCSPIEEKLAEPQLHESRIAASENVMFVVSQFPSNSVSGRLNCTVLEQDGEIYRAFDAEIQLFSQEFWEGYDNGDCSSVFSFAGEAGEDYAQNYRIVAEKIRNGQHELLYPEVTPAVEDDYYCCCYVGLDGELISLCSYGNNSGVQYYSSSDEIMDACAWLREEIKGRSQNP